MAFIVQNDTGTAVDANSYQTVAGFRAYAADHGFDATTYLDPAVQVALVNATTYVDRRFRYLGRKLNGRDQTTQWPRINAYDRDREYIDGVPREVKDATSEYAQRALTGSLSPDTTFDVGGVVISKSEKVGPIEESVTYAQGGAAIFPRYPLADAILTGSGLTVSGGNISRG